MDNEKFLLYNKHIQACTRSCLRWTRFKGAKNMIHTCLTSHIYLNWCFDLSACFDQVWEDSLIADADKKKFSFSPRWTCCRAGIFSVNYKLFTIQAIFLLSHLLRIDGNRYVYKLMHSNQWCIFLAKLYSISIVIIRSHCTWETPTPSWASAP